MDLISRQAAIDTVFSMCCRWDTEDADDLKNMLMLAFQELPSAQPERKKGKWIHLRKCCHKCSVCGNFLDFRGVNAGRGDANFCPNCGADMRGEQNATY